MIETERKFLLADQHWPTPERSICIRQGYLAQADHLVCRVRQKDQGFFLSIKSAIDEQSSYDFEYPIPAADGRIMLDELCTRPPVAKTRHLIKYDHLTWEVDEFHGLNQGLTVAEIELPSPEFVLNLPDWIGEEVTSDSRYRNAALYTCPYQSWT